MSRLIDMLYASLMAQNGLLPQNLLRTMRKSRKHPPVHGNIKNKTYNGEK